MEQIAHKTKFNNNSNLFKSTDELREEANQSNSDDEQGNNTIGGNKKFKSNHNNNANGNWYHNDITGSINNDNDSDMGVNNSYQKNNN